MRRPVLALAAAATLLTGAGVALAVPPVVPSTPVTSPYQSANVTHVGTIPLDGVGVSMKVRKVGDQVRAFVSGAGGLSIYDATDPTKPELLGHLPIYNWENEDIAVSQDGTTAVLTEFEGTVYLHVVDVSNPALPRITGSIVPGGSHTVACADPACGYLYGSEGQTYDIRDRAHPVELAQGWAATLGVSAVRGHNLHQDDAGYWMADANGKGAELVMFKQVDGDPLTLEKVTTGAISKNTGYQHNNIRPRADRYQPRNANNAQDKQLQDGELLLGNGETNVKTQCSAGSGAFSTWSMVGWDHGAPMRQIDTLRPVTGSYANGDAMVNALGCSGHWFDEKDARDGSILVTAAWYEHGTRLLKVDPRSGAISQLGWFQPVRGATSASYFMPTKDGSDVIWSIDYHSGIDILRFDERRDLAPTTSQTDASWLAKLGVKDPYVELSKALCSPAVTGSPARHMALHRQVVTAGRATFPQLAHLS